MKEFKKFMIEEHEGVSKEIDHLGREIKKTQKTVEEMIRKIEIGKAVRDKLEYILSVWEKEEGK